MTSQARRRLPIGIRSFRGIREGNYYYVDKTAYLRDLLDGGRHYCLSRPPAFGKSLFLDTCKELFEGNEPLFRGLDIHSDWDWTVRHPVLRISLAGGAHTPDALYTSLMAQFDAIERRWDVTAGHRSLSTRLAVLVEAVSRKAGRSVVVLVDDYDRPVMEVLGTSARARAILNRLIGVYSVIKDLGASVRFSFFVGMGSLARGDSFGGLNHLIDLTLEPEFSAICGYTEGELESVFAPELAGVDIDTIRDWYHGYSWLGEVVYNPLDVLQALHHREFRVFAYEDGSHGFLLDTLARRRIGSADLDGMLVDGSHLSALEVDRIPTEALLFQAGWLTIGEELDLVGESFFRLRYPNRAVRESVEELLGSR